MHESHTLSHPTSLHSTVTSTIMVPNLPATSRILIQDIVLSKLRGKEEIKDEDIAKLGRCSTRAVRYARSNILHFGTIDAPPNTVGRPKKVTPNMWAALENQIARDPCMTQEEMADSYLAAQQRFSSGGRHRWKLQLSYLNLL